MQGDTVITGDWNSGIGVDQGCKSRRIRRRRRDDRGEQLVNFFRRQWLVLWTTVPGAQVVQQPSRHFPLNLAKIPPNQVNADFGRGSSVESGSE